jgi:hypothetical protein
MFTYDERIVSDLHKDAFGYRPSQFWWEEWKLNTPEQKQREWDFLLRALERSMDDDARREAEAMAQFEATVTTLIESGAKDRETALRWYVDSLDLSEYDRAYGGSYVCFKVGLPYSMQTEFDGVLR